MVLIGAASIGNQPGRAEAISGIAVFAVPLVLFAILLFMLIGAVRASSTARARAMQYQSQYWQYQQNQPTHETMPPAPSSGPGRPPQTPGDSPPPEP